MCFSATASFIAGGSIGTIGIATLKKNKTINELPLAMIPLLFAIQQIIEGIVWLTIFNSPIIYWVAVYIYMFFSHVLWPIWVPLAVMLVENDLNRKKILKLFLMIGIVVGTYLLFLTIRGPVMVQILNNSICYNLDYQYGNLMGILYLLASCISCLFSSHRLIKILGLSILLSFFVTFHAYRGALASVWCFFAAFLSIIIYLHFRTKTVENKASSNFAAKSPA